MNDIALSESDWAPYGKAPTMLFRNFTMQGAYTEQEKWPFVDFAFVRGKIRLAGAVTFRLSYLIITRSRFAPVFQAPGFELASSPPILMANVTAGELLSRTANLTIGIVQGENVAFIQRLCLPPSMFNKSAGSVPRPRQLPGKQQLKLMDQFPNCVNSTTAPYMRRCWSTIGLYVDVASYGIDVGPNGVPFFEDYLMYVVNFLYLCESYMSEHCVQEYSTTGCFIRTLSALSNTSGDPTRTPSNRSALTSSSTPGNDGKTGDSSHVILIGAVVGTVGGVALVAGLVVGYSRWRHKHRLRPFNSNLTGKASTAGASSDDETGGPSGQKPIKLVHTVMKGCTEGEMAVKSRQDEAASLVPVTPLTPLAPGVNLRLQVAAEVQLTPTRLGAGTFGTVFQGFYCGESVAVKLVKVGLRTHQAAAAAAKAAVGDSAAGAAAAAGPGAEAVAVPGPADEVPAEAGAAGAAAASADVEPQCGVVAQQQRPPPPQQQQQQQQQQEEEKVAVEHGSVGSGGDGAVQQEGGEPECDLHKVLTLSATTCLGSSTVARRHAMLQEVEVLARCQHPNIVRLLAASVEGPSMCLVMELMDTSLERVLYGSGEQDGLLPLPKVLHIGIQIARALSYLHPTILHRDLKPGNVLIKDPHSDTPVVKLADFGLSRLLDTVLLTRHPEVGTAPYMAPEVFDLENIMVTDRADIYSLGVLLYELLAARRPWESLTIVQVAFNVTVKRLRPPLDEVSESRCPAKLRALIRACWEADPSRRPAAAEIVKMLMLVKQEVDNGVANHMVVVDVAPPAAEGRAD